MPILDRFSLEGKTAVVTGGTGLYGLPFARALAEAGAHVVITSRSAGKAEEAAATLGADGLTATGLALDLADPDGIHAFAAGLTASLGAPDILVNNAVHRAGTTLSATTAENWDETSAVNSRGLFLLTQAVAPGMSARGSGSIINIGSIYGLVGPDFGIYDGTPMTMPAFYSYDKAGMVGFTRYLATLLGPTGVRANCLCPGGLRSDGQDARFVDAYEARVPLGRLAEEDDVTGSLVFLASDASAYVTGVTLAVDGGWTAK
ncbi:SDR family NAD(P)-dependent oxidoreductase [Herbiconiux sp. P17]|uniref:SDR family NAD(P)-dependent oxidoreductase n=1 Tax=Herbiconiux wuyangfengii TaxID=3342794 RepID=UPI0035B9C069